ncbi:MAG: TIGR00725 family protein [Thermoplasmata archaeon]
MKLIGVIGGQKPEDEYLALAEEVGYLIAKRGAALICGGLTGVMEAACRGAKRGGGLTIGVIPTVRKADANPFVDVVIATGMGTARNVIIVRTADALIAIDGSFGTLSEISHAFEQGRTVVSLGSWEMGKIGVPPEMYEVARNPEEAVEMAMKIADNPGDSSLPF